VDRHQGWAQRPDGLRVHIFMGVRPTESGKAQSFRRSKRGVSPSCRYPAGAASQLW
jgi:hypothetical protein